MGIASDLADIKEVSDTIVANKVSKFCYTDTAYEDNNADGVIAYDINNEQNIPVGTPSVMKVNETVVTKGWRARASSITRMFMNHMLGRLSYNVNKLTDMFQSLLTDLNANLGTANGLATLDSESHINLPQILGSDAMLNSTTNEEWLAKVFSQYLGHTWKKTEGMERSSGFWTLVKGNNIVVALPKSSGGGDMMTAKWSENGKDWYAVTGIPAGLYVTDDYNVVFAGGKFVALMISSGSYVSYISVDGKNWTEGNTVSGGRLSYGNGLYISSGSESANWSEDGLNWTACTGLPSVGLGIVTCENGVWYDLGVNTVYWSSDGKAFSAVTNIGTSNSIAIKYFKGVWVLVQQTHRYWSSDGHTFTAGTGISEGTYVSFNFVMNDDVCIISLSSSPYTPYYTNDGKNWVSATIFASAPSGTLSLKKCNNLFLAISSGDHLFSTTGEMWYSLGVTHSTDGRVLNSFAEMNGKFFTLAEKSGTDYYRCFLESTNLKDWSPVAGVLTPRSVNSIDMVFLSKSGTMILTINNNLYYSDISTIDLIH